MATHEAGVSKPTGRYDAMCAFSAVGEGRRPWTPAPKPLPERSLEGAGKQTHDVGDARGHGERRLLDGGAGRPAAVVEAAEER